MLRLIIIIFVFLNCTLINAQTYFYAISQQLSNGTTKPLSHGQFITFTHSTTNMTCYESDKDGFTVNNGVMLFEESINEQDKYEGECYWGSKCVYLVDREKSKIAVTVPDGRKYVYIKTVAPTSQVTCSFIKHAQQKENYDVSYNRQLPIVQLLHPQGGSAIDNPTYEKPQKEKKQWRTITKQIDCNHCGHSGKCSTCNGKGWYYTTGVGTNAADCPNCDGFKTGKCRYCHGVGYTTKTERVYE